MHAASAGHRFSAIAGRIHSSGYVFRPVEMSGLIESAGLKVIRRYVVDYQTGESRQFFFEGQLLYELAKK
jgi:hypothetical protein